MYYQKENFNGVYDFRCRPHNSFIVGSHIHEYSEILYCRKGDCEILINGKELHLSDNEFVFIPPNYIHRYNCTEVDLICAVFSNDFIPLYFNLTGGKKLKVNKFKAEKLTEIFNELPKTDKSDALLITAYLNIICNKVIDRGEFEKSSATDGILYQKVISYLADNFKEDVSLKGIADKFGYNKKYLSYALHSLTGIHFSDFIAMYRVEYAKELLLKYREKSVAEIAGDCGFTAINTFNRQFKKMTLMTPSEYRRLC